MVMDALGSGEQAEGWWKANDWQSSGQWMSANDEIAWEPEEPVGGYEINGSERCWSKSPRRSKEQRVRRWQRPSVKTREEGARDQEATHSSSADSRHECTDKEKTNSDQPHADRAKSRGTTRDTTRHEDLHRRPS